MSTFRQIYYQIVFSTKGRENTIPEEHEQELFKYVWGIINNHNCKLYRINGMADHIHIFSDLHPAISLADYIKKLKTSSGTWMKENGKFSGFRGWQNGYAAFTYSIRDKDTIIEYVKNQKIHHQTKSFLEEYKELLHENRIEFDEKYLL